jgi:AcrR family transcriptional regulator
MTEKADKRGNRELSIKKIVKATEEVIEEKGYFDTKIKDIHEKADVSIGLIYKYFPKGKPEIIIEIMKREPIFQGITNITDDRINQILNLPSKEFVKAVKRVFIAIIQTHRKQAIYGPAVERAMQSNKELYAELYELSNSNMALIPVISRILQKFNYPEERLEQRSELIIHTIDSLIHRHTFYGEIVDTDEELADYLTELFLKFVGFDNKIDF